MPKPTLRDVHPSNVPLTNISIAYRNTMYIAPQVFPIVSVDKKSDLYFAFDKQAWLQNRSGYRAPGTKAPRADYGISTASYLCVSDALAKPVPQEVIDNADAPLRPLVTATRFVSDALDLGMEKRVADLITASGSWASASNPGTKWDVDTSDAWGDINTAIDAVEKTIARPPNVMIISKSAWKALANHPDFVDRVKYQREGGQLLPADMMGWFGVDKVLIGRSVIDTAAEGATSSISYVWGDMLWVGYVANAPALEEPSAGYVFRWGNRQVYQHYEEQERQYVVEAEWFTDEVISASDAGAGFFDISSD